MADLPETVMDTAALSAPVALPQPDTPMAVSATP